MKRIFPLLLVLFTATTLLASNKITYTAEVKLPGHQGSLDIGATTFGHAIISHEFTDGAGTIVCDGEVTMIGDWAFYGCSGLTSIEIPNSVTTIGASAFNGCYGLTSVTIPNSVTTIGEYAFAVCSDLTSINVDAANTHYCSIDGVLFNYAKDTLIQYPIGNKRTKYEIPNSVTTIGDAAFANCFSLTSIEIPNSVTTIGSQAFDNCAYLTSIDIPNSVTTIGNRAFDNCSSLTSVTIGNSVTTIGEYAFHGCYGLTSITIPNSVTTIGYQAFTLCAGLTSINVDAANTHYCSIDGVLFNYAKDTLIQYPIGNKRTKYTIPNSVTTIGDYAFAYCSGLTSITIPDSVTTIGNSSFSDCTSLTSIEIPKSVTTIGKASFYNCSSLSSIDLPNSVTTIGARAFNGCTGLTSVSIGNSVTTIGSGAFAWCRGLTSVTIPNSVTTIGSGAFQDCTNLQSISCEVVVPPQANDAFYGCDYTIPLYVPLGTKEAYQTAEGWKKFTNIYEIPSNTITYTATEKLQGENGRLDIGATTFGPAIISHEFTEGVGTIVCKGEITIIGENAFDLCRGLTSITIPNSVITIGEWAFGNCYGLTSIEIPNSVTTIGEWAFSGCSGLISIEIPNSVTTIENDAFYRCLGLTSVTIGNSVTTIGTNAFCYCYAIKSVTFGNSVTEIGSGAFYRCTSLTSIKIPDSVKKIGKGAFADCSSLTSVTIGKSVTLIDGGSSFNNCISLTSIDVDAANTHYCSVDSVLFNFSKDELVQYPIGNRRTEYNIPNSVTTISNYAFNYCSYLTSINVDAANTHFCSDNGVLFNFSKNKLIQYPVGNTRTEYEIPNSVTTIKDHAFCGCSNLTSIEIPTSVTTIEGYAFFECGGLTSITIPYSVTTIGIYTFSYCSNLNFVSCGATVPPNAKSSAFTDCNHTIPLYVPLGTKEAYQTAEGWQKFTNIQETLPVADSITTTSAVIMWQKVDSAVSYTLSVIETESADTIARYEIDSTGNIIKELRLSYAPQRVLDTTVSSAEIFEVSLTNLSSGTTYTYAIDAKDSESTIINSSAGTFTTKSETAINTIKEKKTFYHRPINTLGQPIDPKTHQGIYIQNGKKYLNIW